ncbi:MAG TPA: hypothetical protein PKE47_06775, partial [Verrucomicrobiota bacterium]|nr:hypothetical protein [Verrucomicrobiota bacterium]
LAPQLSALEALDARLHARAHALTAINAERRARAQQLAPEVRAAAWWWTAFSDPTYDGLVELLAQRVR